MKRFLKPLYIVVSISVLIFVGLAFKDKNMDKSCLNFKELSYQERHLCWYNQMEGIIKSKGVDSAFDKLVSLYDKEPTFRSGCHDVTHLIGEAVYKNFANDLNFEFTDKTSYCGYGFYHGFIETLLYSGRTLGEAKEFCEKINTQFEGEIKTPNAIYSCYHGMGHSMFDIHDESVWGDEEKMVYPALDVCEEVTEGIEEEKLKQCSTGVFNALGIAYSSNDYSLEMRESDPVWFCRDQKELYKKSCYAEVILAWVYTNGKGSYQFDEAMDYIKSIKDLRALEIGAFVTASDYVRQNRDVFNEINMSEKCQSLDDPMREWCIKGVVESLMGWSSPGEEYKDILAFCVSDSLTQTDKEHCLDYFLPRVGTLYSEKKTATICDSIEEPYKKQCN